MKYKVLYCAAGLETLQEKLDSISKEGLTVISVLPDHATSFKDKVIGYLIVVAVSPAENNESMLTETP